MLGESRTLNRRGKPKQTLRCTLFGHKAQRGRIAIAFNPKAMQAQNLIKAAYEGWGCSRLGCGWDHSNRDPKADALLPRLFLSIGLTKK